MFFKLFCCYIFKAHVTILINNFGSVVNLTSVFNKTLLSTVLHFFVETVWQILQACLLARDICCMKSDDKFIGQSYSHFTTLRETNFKKIKNREKVSS